MDLPLPEGEIFITLTEDQVDDLLYLARTGSDEFESFALAICIELDIALKVLFGVVWDEENGNGLLHYSAANGHLSIMEIICTALSDIAPLNPPMLKVVNKQNKAGNTALHWAAMNGQLEAVKFLLEQGADLTIKNARGYDAIFEAELNDKSEIVEWALNSGVKGLQMGIGDDEEAEKAENGDIKFESAGDMNDSGLAEDSGAEVVDADPKVVSGIIEELGQLKVGDEKKD